MQRYVNFHLQLNEDFREGVWHLFRFDVVYRHVISCSREEHRPTASDEAAVIYDMELSDQGMDK